MVLYSGEFALELTSELPHMQAFWRAGV